MNRMRNGEERRPGTRATQEEQFQYDLERMEIDEEPGPGPHLRLPGRPAVRRTAQPGGAAQVLLMNENIQMLQESAQSYDQERRDKAQEVLGESIEDLRAFTHVAMVWFLKAKNSSSLGDILVSKDPDVTRLLAIRNLTNTAVLIAREIPSMLAAGNNHQMVTAWRILAEAKNNALFIHMDTSGEAADRWMIFQAAKANQADPEDPYLKGMVKNARKQMKKRGENHKNSENWARAPNGKAYQGNIARCEFVWKNKKSTQLISEEEQTDMANREKRMLRKPMP